MTTLKEYMASNSITQAKMAEMIGVSQPHVYRFISGNKVPTLATAKKISEVTEGQVPASSWPTIAALIREVSELD